MNADSSVIRGIIRPLPWLHLIAIAAVLLQPAARNGVLGGYSRTALLVAALLILTLPLVLWATARLGRVSAVNLPNLPRYIRLSGICIAVVAAAALGWISALNATAYIIVSLYLLYVLVTITVFLLLSRDAPSWGNERSLTRLAGAVLMLVAALQILLAFHFPGQLWTDEGYNTALSLSIARDGAFIVPFFRLTPEISGPNC
ncbi:hypothetical protein J4558_24670 [Leptolyngbya sp. 15MV]|nr:hypothetical protein J4558_24670 [Leptolyngbya sp. 15MV]